MSVTVKGGVLSGMSNVVLIAHDTIILLFLPYASVDQPVLPLFLLLLVAHSVIQPSSTVLTRDSGGVCSLIVHR